MLSDLTPPQRALADYMSDLSEEAYHASWMHGLEFDLWKALKGELQAYGRLKITEKHRKNLHKLSKAIDGWILFDKDKEETFISTEEWLAYFDSQSI